MSRVAVSDLETATPVVASESPPARISRRRWLRRGAAAAAATLTYGWRIEPHWVEVIRRSLPIDNLPSSLIGARLVQISDVHAGPVVDQRFLLEWAERIADLEPDLLVLTGDYVTMRGENSVPKAVEFVRRLPRPRLGILGILGNHDYGFYEYRQTAANVIVQEFLDQGVRMLRNDVADVEGLQFCGVDDYFSWNFFPELAMKQLDLRRPAVGLVHNPDAVHQQGWGEFRGWILAGHTHGGQVKPPLLPPPVLPIRDRRYVAGEYDLGDGRRLYVNRGLGYMQRIRLNCRPEITVFTLEPAPPLA